MNCFKDGRETSEDDRPTKALVSTFAGKVMAIIFCDIQGVILNHFVPPKFTVTGNFNAKFCN